MPEAATIEVRPVHFDLGETPATNPRIERRGDTVTHIEVFAPFTVNDDGSADTRVAETSADMDSVSAAIWVKEAKIALGYNVRTFSKRKCVVALKSIGVWSQVKEWIIAQDLYDEYLAAQDFREDNPHFVQGRAALQAALGWSDEQVEAVLAQCVADPAQ